MLKFIKIIAIPFRRLNRPETLAGLAEVIDASAGHHLFLGLVAILSRTPTGMAVHRWPSASPLNCLLNTIKGK